MKEYPKLRLTAARTRAEVIKDQYPNDKFLTQVAQRIIEDIKATIMFDELGVDSNENREGQQLESVSHH